MSAGGGNAQGAQALMSKMGGGKAPAMSGLKGGPPSPQDVGIPSPQGVGIPSFEGLMPGRDGGGGRNMQGLDVLMKQAQQEDPPQMARTGGFSSLFRSPMGGGRGTSSQSAFRSRLRDRNSGSGQPPAPGKSPSGLSDWASGGSPLDYQRPSGPAEIPQYDNPSHVDFGKPGTPSRVWAEEQGLDDWFRPNPHTGVSSEGASADGHHSGLKANDLAVMLRNRRK